MKRIKYITVCVAIACLMAGCAQEATTNGAASEAVVANVERVITTERKEEPEPALSTTTTETEAATSAPAATARPETEQEAVSVSTPTPSPEPTPIPTQSPTPTQAKTEQASMSYGEVPFNLAAGSDKWWYIDSTDSAYWAVADNINAMRAAAGLNALTVDGGLSSAASARCESFVAGGPFDHSGMTTRSEICASGPLCSASAVCTGWQGSSAHYANIMEPSFTSMGIGCWFCQIDGNNFTYWCVTFA